MPNRGLSVECPSPRPACLVAVPTLEAIYFGLGPLILAGARGIRERACGFWRWTTTPRNCATSGRF